MKKQIFALLLVLALLVTVTVFAVEADEPVVPIAFDEDNADSKNKVEAYCEHCKDNVTWVAMTVGTNGSPAFNGTHSYVPRAGLTTSRYVTVNREQCLYLNGQITHSGSTDADLFRFYTSTTDSKVDIILSVMGDATYGKIVSTASSPVFNATRNMSTDGSTYGLTQLNMYSGTVDATGSTANSGPVFYEKSDNVPEPELNMYGGTFYGSTQNTAVNGGTVYIQKGTFNMYDGLISGGKIMSASSTVYGGNICLGEGSTFYMDGGTIENGYAYTTTKAVSAYGGNVHVGKNSTFTMTGGIIKKGTADGTRSTNSTSTSSGAYKARGGNISFLAGCTVEISGDAEISGGTACSKFGSYGGNIYITGTSDNGVTISGNAQISGGQTTVNLATQTSTTSANTKASMGGNIYLADGKLNIQGGTISGGVCYDEKNESYTEGNCRGASIYQNGGEIVMTGGQLTHSVTARRAAYGGIVYMSAGTFTINGENALIEGGYANRGGSICVFDGTLKLQKGTISGGKSALSGGSVHADGVFEMTGGTIDGGEATNSTGSGGAVYAGESFTMTGGTINGGEATNGGALAINKAGVRDNVAFVKAEISGGTITGSDVFVASGYKLTVVNGFTGNLDVCFEGTAGDVLDGNKIVSTAAASDGYFDGGMVFAEIDGVKYPVVGDGTNMLLAEAVITNGDGQILKIPANAQAAVDTSLNNGEYVELQLAGTSFAPTVATRVDFNGKDATVTGGADMLTGMDSATNDYDADGAAEVTFTTGTPALNNVVDLVKGTTAGQRKYLALSTGEPGVYSYHRYYLTIDGAGLRYNKDDDKAPGLLYSAAFKGDAAVAAEINKGGEDYGYGIDYFIGEDFFTGVDFAESGVPFAADGQIQTGKKVAFSGFMTQEEPNTDDAGTYLANIVFTGKAYIEIAGEKFYCSVGDENSLQDVVKMYYNSTNAHIVDMKEKYGNVFGKILGWDFAA